MGHDFAVERVAPEVAPLRDTPVTRPATPAVEAPAGVVARRPGHDAPSTRIRRATALPDDLKAGIESMSGISLDGVRVHRRSSRPAQLHAQAFTDGDDIHIGPGQEEHLAHEAWHVVQQAQGRVRPRVRMGDGVRVNDDVALEREADVMGARALARPPTEAANVVARRSRPAAVQLRWGQFGGRDRDAARLILQAIGRIDPFDYQLGGFLEELLHEGVTSAALQTAATQMVNDLTSVVRTRSLVNALQGGAGLPVAFAQEAVQACPLDNGTLDPLLALFAQLHQAGGAAPGVAVATVCSQLLTNGQATGPLVAAVQQVPDLLTTVARATAVIAFRQAGGTDADACLAAQFAGANDVVLVEMLTALPPLVALARVRRVGPGAQGRRAR